MSAMISVIVPVYNAIDCIERCVNSILKQTYPDFELILVDDGSSDGTGAVLDEFAKKDSRILVFHKENGGSSSARNLGIKEAKGSYFSFIDSDDYVEPVFLEALVTPVLRAEEKGEELPFIVQTGRNEIDEAGNVLPDICTPPRVEEIIAAEDFFRSLILHVGDCSFCTKLIKREAFDGLCFPLGKLNEDFRLLVQMLVTGLPVVNLPGYNYHVVYRMGSNSRKKDKNDFSRVFKDSVDNADLVEEIVGKSFPTLRKEAVRFGLFQRMDYLLHIPIACMRKDYEGYPEIVGYIRKNWWEGMVSPYLTAKNKLYITLFAVAPKFVRVVHARIKHI